MKNTAIVGSSGAATPTQKEQLPVKIKYCIYARKSTESEERQILSIDSQIKEMLQLAEREGLDIVEIKRESHSAKETGTRPIFNEIIEEIKQGKFNAILTWAPDRISRNAGDLGKIVDLIDQKLLVEIRTFGQKFTNSPSEKFLLMILGSQAKLENDQKGVNVKRGLRSRCEMGLRPGMAPTGYLNEKRMDRKCHVLVDSDRAPIIKKMYEKVAYEKWSGRKVYHWLKFDINFRTKSNHHLSLSNIYIILQNSFYYGVFEYPEKSGNWYTGKHTPIITKELFDTAQEQLKRDQIVRSELKEFAFTKLITCGLCGSGVTADEKFKKRKDGSTIRYVYYGCTRSRDIHCKCGYLREEDLIEQLIKLLDKIDLNDMHMGQKFEEEVTRLNKFQKTFFGAKKMTKSNVKQINLRDYAEYVLREGAVVDKREFLGCIKSRFTLANKMVKIQKIS